MESVLNQKYPSWELILVDDGSTDTLTIQLCDSFASVDKRIKVFHKKNEGQLLTRCFGMKKSKGQYLCFLDSDDYLDTAMLSKVNAVIEKYNCDLVLFRYRWMGTRFNRKSRKLFPNYSVFTVENAIDIKKRLCEGVDLNNIWAKVVKRELACVDCDFSDYAKVRYGEDKIQSIPILFSFKKAVYIKDVLYYYVSNPQSITRTAQSNRKYRLQYENYKIINKMLAEYVERFNNNDPELMNRLRASLFENCMSIVKQYERLSNAHDKEYLDFITGMQNDQYLIESVKKLSPKMICRKNRKLFEKVLEGKLVEYVLGENGKVN